MVHNVTHNYGGLLVDHRGQRCRRLEKSGQLRGRLRRGGAGRRLGHQIEERRWHGRRARWRDQRGRLVKQRRREVWSSKRWHHVSHGHCRCRSQVRGERREGHGAVNTGGCLRGRFSRAHEADLDGRPHFALVLLARRAHELELNGIAAAEGAVRTASAHVLGPKGNLRRCRQEGERIQFRKTKQER